MWLKNSRIPFIVGRISCRCLCLCWCFETGMGSACLRSLRDVQKAGEAEGGAKPSNSKPCTCKLLLAFPERRTFVGCSGLLRVSTRPPGRRKRRSLWRRRTLRCLWPARGQQGSAGLGLAVNPSGRGLARQKRSGAISSTTGEGFLAARGDSKFKRHRC